jgi:Xaa-Pro aminopeptidase
MVADPSTLPTRDGYPTFSPAEIGRRHAAVRAALREQNFSCLVLYGAGRFHSDIQYLSNWPGGREAYVVLPVEAEPVLLAQLFNHVPMAQRLSLIGDTRWAGADSVASLADLLAKHAPGRARVALVGGLPFSQYAHLSELLPETTFVDWNREFRRLRLVRSAEEIAFFHIAAELTDRSIDRLACELRPGLRESELAALVEGPYLEAGGYAGIHFMTSTPMGKPDELAFVPHQYQSDRLLQAGDALITEISGGFWGYSGQIHRTFFLGEPTHEWTRLHRAAESAYAAIEAVLHDGATVDDVLDAAEVIQRAGYTIFDDLLHGADQYPPILKTRATAHSNPPGDFVFRGGMVVTLQPQLTTVDQRIGLQFGETIVVRRDGVERLHRYPRQMVICHG